MRKLEIEGKWFIPSQPELKIFGKLKFEPFKGTELKLYGSFPINGFENYDIICGTSSEGRAVTLFNSFLTSNKMNSSRGFSITKYFVNFVFVGVYCDSVKDLCFNRIDIKFKYFDEWLNLSGFNISRSSNRRSFNIDYNLPNDIVIKLNNQSSLTIQNSYEVPGGNQRQEFGIKQFSFVRIDHKRKVKFKKILQEILHFQNLLTLFIQYSPTPNSVELYFKEGRKQNLNKVEVFYSLMKPKRTKEKIHWHDMFIPYNLVKDDLSKIVIEWMNQEDRMSNILNPFFSTFHSPFFYVSDKFLNLAKSMEAFHRDKVRDSARFTFRVRIEELLKNYSSLYNGLVKIKSKRDFAEKVKNIRNLFTHSNLIIGKVDKHNMRLYRMSNTLQLIMTCILLKEFGVKKELIKEKVENSIIFIHLER